MNYELEFSPNFNRKLKKLLKGNPAFKKRVEKTLETLSRDPFSAPLKTHKISIRSGVHYSSKVTGDIRIIWNFIDKKTVLLLITIGGHEGSRGVYK
jgi:mRNA-degrading endonuclease YafQ of YafQ-DinJ toxin-antitoxin module